MAARAFSEVVRRVRRDRSATPHHLESTRHYPRQSYHPIGGNGVSRYRCINLPPYHSQIGGPRLGSFEDRGTTARKGCQLNYESRWANIHCQAFRRKARRGLQM